MSSPTLPPVLQNTASPNSVPITASRGRALVFLFLVAGFVTCADLLLKRGAMEAHPPGSVGVSPIANLYSLYTVAGIVCHLAGLASWMMALRTIPVALAYTFTLMQQATIALGAWLWLGEHITPLRWGGIALVFVGVLALVPEIAAAESFKGKEGGG